MKYILPVLLLTISLHSKTQTPLVLPNDPVIIRSEQQSNWLKESTEDALNNTADYSYDLLADFAYYFIKYSKALSTIGRSESLSNTVFNWAKPYIKEKIYRLSITDKIKLHNSLKHSIGYLQAMDYAYEQRYLTANKDLFFYQGPKDFFDEDWRYPYPYYISNDDRRFEAFLFRRLREGIDKGMMLRFLQEVLSYIDVNFSGPVATGLYEFYWDRTRFDGYYSEFQRSKIYGKDQTWLKVSGKYQNGKKEGVWKYFTVENNERLLEYEIEYKSNAPTKLTVYSTENIKTEHSGTEVYSLVLKLDILYKTLDVTVYSHSKQVMAYNSIHDNIDYWDIYDTKRRIVSNLSTPNFDISISKKIRLEDKPDVPRNKETSNYTLYDRLRRKNKDHALLIATDDYSFYGGSQKLKNPIRDAEAIAEDLESIYGFDCEIVRNPTKAEFLHALEKYKHKKMEDDEQLLIFISGHGSYEPSIKEGFIVPKDGKEAYYDFNHSSWISYTELVESISNIPSNHILLTIDACYSGSLEYAVSKLKNDDDDDFRKRTGDPEKWFFSRIKFKTKTYVTSSAANRVTSDGINHSPFASMFIQGLRSFGDKKTHILTIADVYSYIDRINPPPVKDHFKDNDPESTFFFIMK